jgi:hypothetical protein
MIGRLALFDVLVRLGDKNTALIKAAAWMPHWRKVSIQRPAGTEGPAARLVRMMIDTDAAEARKILCVPQRGGAAAAADRWQENLCPMTPVDTVGFDFAAAKSTLSRTGTHVDEQPGSQPEPR